MQLSSRQIRVFKLAILLSTGKKVPTIKIISALECSEPTLTRVLKEIRESYSAEIKYSKSSRSYQMTERGQLDNKTLRRMREALSSNEELQHSGTTSRVYLDKDKKKSVSLSLKMSALRTLRKIDKLSFLRSTTRSQTVEFLVDNYVEHLIQVALQDKK
ncbi:tellurium resistance protein TerW [Proteus mirabilis]|nr:tellurium resistance protein TerW [Proteus mirabilis]EKV7174014.1 tellurium resistance protein TerW [Proteus mirabilis]EKW8529455.1 tellurium resistance protein TerW [Proteus mirabilis]EKW9433118.1 tellurium resistance protein TerW [Proteus mirabilis]EKW9945402.1 tellurium resistance protein TerW [Proteus mirabilis]